LLSSQNQDNDFVVELDNDGLAHLRFGNGELGRLPEAGTKFTATYRVGNGLAGNVGAEAISYLGLRRTTLSGVTLRVRNPFPAQGGIEPEPLAEVKLFAPYAFRTDLQRAITAADYAHLVERDFESKAQRAAAALRWTGSWYEAQVAIDQRGKQEADQDLLDAISARLRRYRRIGHDLAVASARHVALDIVIEVCVLPHYLRGHVKAALLDIFSNRPLGVPDGRRGFFHPDNLTFGEGIYLSKLVAAAQAVTGVESVRVTRLKRRFEGPNGEIESGFLPLSPMEIAQLDNDPSFPEQGILVLDVRGGR
jgi:predicted phage baseplate assembly protein